VSTVSIVIHGGPSVSVPWFQGMNAQQALESAYQAIGNGNAFTYALQYYGANFGYMVVMINETYDSFISSSAPFFYWHFFLNGSSANSGIDSTILQPGDTIGFSFDMYVAETHAGTQLETKYNAQVHTKNTDA
jgi:Domain of unknown function (DUF4430)